MLRNQPKISLALVMVPKETTSYPPYNLGGKKGHSQLCRRVRATAQALGLKAGL